MKSIIYILSILFFTYGCGFKVMNQSELQNFYITDVEATGDNRINFNLKNKLNFKGKDNSKNSINLKIDTKKIKKIKEKDVTNEITKFLISISLEVKVDRNFKTIKVFNLTEEKDYNVDKQYSQTIVNENQTVKSLSESLAKKILREISLINFNDL